VKVQIMDAEDFADPGGAALRSCLAVVLAAGEGTRMQSALPKVLHELAGRSMLAHVLSTVAGAGAAEVAVVAGPDHGAVIAEARKTKPDAAIAVQDVRLGTAHAVLAARQAIARGYDDLLIVYADTPLVRPEILCAMRRKLATGKNAAVVLGFKAKAPAGYGRLIMENGRLHAIREERDATGPEREITLCNAGLMALDGRRALSLLEAIGNANSKKEYYLTDIVAVARARGLAIDIEIAPEEEALGINDKEQLAAAESLLQARLRKAAMHGGATLIDPSSVTLAFDTVLGRDTVIEPHVVFAPGVKIGEGTRVRSFSYLERSVVGPNAIIGPFARLRPGNDLAQDVHIGNFVELKASTIGQGAKINHLSYIGDAGIGAKANVGAGTITCNYDGLAKHRTEIGENAFIGSNSSLVAPVKIGAGAYIGSGSVITEDVAPGAMALGRARQVEKPGRGKRFRQPNALDPGQVRNEAEPADSLADGSKKDGV
jgi:bifunctional UDP-N-acetylglucosamine pyrophosphorylase/glucosamine-1-phosphate N-acetyltransferase